MRDELGLRGKDLLALETAVRPGLAVDAGGVLGQVSPPEGRVVALVASEGRFAVDGWNFYALTVLRLWGNILLDGC